MCIHVRCWPGAQCDGSDLQQLLRILSRPSSAPPRHGRLHNIVRVWWWIQLDQNRCLQALREGAAGSPKATTTYWDMRSIWYPVAALLMYVLRKGPHLQLRFYTVTSCCTLVVPPNLMVCCLIQSGSSRNQQEEIQQIWQLHQATAADMLTVLSQQIARSSP